ncbi:hypothetical protein ACTD5D_41145 [Nocardia takedensis]|uniref:hypothetical protein n=1 Tax=Nocardia takedensis TaxID=259390 RepID=UPI003F759E71
MQRADPLHGRGCVGRLVLDHRLDLGIGLGVVDLPADLPDGEPDALGLLRGGTALQGKPFAALGRRGRRLHTPLGLGHPDRLHRASLIGGVATGGLRLRVAHGRHRHRLPRGADRRSGDLLLHGLLTFGLGAAVAGQLHRVPAGEPGPFLRSGHARAQSAQRGLHPSPHRADAAGGREDPLGQLLGRQIVRGPQRGQRLAALGPAQPRRADDLLLQIHAAHGQRLLATEPLPHRIVRADIGARPHRCAVGVDALAQVLAQLRGLLALTLALLAQNAAHRGLGGLAVLAAEPGPLRVRDLGRGHDLRDSLTSAPRGAAGLLGHVVHLGFGHSVFLSS